MLEVKKIEYIEYTEFVSAKFDLEKILRLSYEHYRFFKFDTDHRPLSDVDHQDLSEGSLDQYLTFSESVSYALFMALIMNDQICFNHVWEWTYKNLWRHQIKEWFDWHENKWVKLPEHKRDGLFCWRWTPNIKGTERGGVIHYIWKMETAGDLWRDGSEVAPDGDQLIAGCLILAAERWGNGKLIFDYKTHAQTILKSLWQKIILQYNPARLADFLDPDEKSFWFLYCSPKGSIDTSIKSEPYAHLEVKIQGADWAGTGKVFSNLDLSQALGLQVELEAKPQKISIIMEDHIGKKAQWLVETSGKPQNLKLPFKNLAGRINLKKIRTVMLQPQKGSLRLKKIQALHKTPTPLRYHLVSNEKKQPWINLSYYIPFLYQEVFPRIDKKHPWPVLSKAATDDFKRSFQLKSRELKIKSNEVLPPDWYALNAQNEVEGVPFISALEENCYLSSWDAFRVWWYWAVSFHYNPTASMQHSLKPAANFFRQFLNKQQHIPTGFLLNGQTTAHRGCNLESPGANGCYIALFSAMGDRTTAARILMHTNKHWLQEDRHGYFWGNNPVDYYGQVWMWLGLAFYLGKLDFIKSKKKPSRAS